MQPQLGEEIVLHRLRLEHSLLLRLRCGRPPVHLSRAFDLQLGRADVANLNLLYVAFTRASRNLFIIGKRGASGSRSALIEQCLPLVAEQLESSTIEGMENNDATIRFTFGAPDTAKPKDKTTENVLLSGSQPVPVTTMQHESDVVFRK